MTAAAGVSKAGGGWSGQEPGLVGAGGLRRPIRQTMPFVRLAVAAIRLVNPVSTAAGSSSGIRLRWSENTTRPGAASGRVPPSISPMTSSGEPMPGISDWIPLRPSRHS